MRNAWPQKVINMNKLSYLKCAVFALIGLIVASAFSLTIIELMGAQTDLQFSVQRYWGKAFAAWLPKGFVFVFIIAWGGTKLSGRFLPLKIIAASLVLNMLGFTFFSKPPQQFQYIARNAGFIANFPARPVEIPLAEGAISLVANGVSGPIGLTRIPLNDGQTSALRIDRLIRSMQSNDNRRMESRKNLTRRNLNTVEVIWQSQQARQITKFITLKGEILVLECSLPDDGTLASAEVATFLEPEWFP
jgi:hypothetical protein